MTQVEEVDAFRALQPVLAVLSPEDRDVLPSIRRASRSGEKFRSHVV